MIIPGQNTVNQVRIEFSLDFRMVQSKPHVPSNHRCDILCRGGRWPKIFDKLMHYIVARASLNETGANCTNCFIHISRASNAMCHVFHPLCLTTGPIPALDFVISYSLLYLYILVRWALLSLPLPMFSDCTTLVRILVMLGPGTNTTRSIQIYHRGTVPRLEQAPNARDPFRQRSREVRPS